MATINYDHTTEVLSPRFLDRAWIIRMENSGAVDLFTDTNANENIKPEVTAMSYSDFKQYFTANGNEYKDKQISLYSKEVLTTIVEQFCKNGHAISPRTVTSMKRYCVVAEQYMSDKTVVVDYAVMQKLLPLINGNGKQYLEFLENLSITCKNLVKSSEILKRIIETGKKEHNYFNYFNI